MKITKLLSVNEKHYKIVSDSIVLEKDNAGRGIFVVQSRQALSGLVTLTVGMGLSFERYFTGYIESCNQIDQKQQRLMIREPAAVLAKRWTISQRNTNAREILKYLYSESGCAFNLELAEWTARPIPHFINTGSGYDALDLLKKELNIPDFTWLTQPDGSIYIGSLASAKVNKTILGLQAGFFTDLSVAGANCPLVPEFRPGKRIRIGNGEVVTIESVTTSGESMRINF